MKKVIRIEKLSSGQVLRWADGPAMHQVVRDIIVQFSVAANGGFGSAAHYIRILAREAASTPSERNGSSVAAVMTGVLRLAYGANYKAMEFDGREVAPIEIFQENDDSDRPFAVAIESKDCFLRFKGMPLPKEEGTLRIEFQIGKRVREKD